MLGRWVWVFGDLIGEGSKGLFYVVSEVVVERSEGKV